MNIRTRIILLLAVSMLVEAAGVSFAVYTSMRGMANAQFAANASEQLDRVGEFISSFMQVGGTVVQNLANLSTLTTSSSKTNLNILKLHHLCTV